VNPAYLFDSQDELLRSAILGREKSRGIIVQRKLAEVTANVVEVGSDQADFSGTTFIIPQVSGSSRFGGMTNLFRQYAKPGHRCGQGQMLLESPVCSLDDTAPCSRNVFIGCTLGIKEEETVNVAGRLWFQRGVLFLWC
jgi:hypothetical protein